jgi:hypothetical protein
MHPKLRGFNGDEATRAKLDRIYRLEDACVQAQGDDPIGGLWCHKNSSEFGVWAAPTHYASESEEGLQRALARLAELAPGFTPRRLPQRKGRRRARRSPW